MIENFGFLQYAFTKNSDEIKNNYKNLRLEKNANFEN